MRSIAPGAVLLLVAACQAPPAEMSDAERAQVEAEVVQVMETFLDGFSELDADKIAATLHPDWPVFPYGGRILNRAEYREAIAAWLEVRESWKGGWVDTHVRVLSPDLAVFQGGFQDTIRFSDGQHIHYPNHAFAALFERTSEGWRWSVGGSSGVAQPVEEG